MRKLEEHKELVESYKHKNSIIDPPSENKLFRLVKIQGLVSLRLSLVMISSRFRYVFGMRHW